jgi:chromosome segregation ATPase
MANIEELENRVRYVESEVEGEKLVTRSVLEQSTRNGAVLHSLRSELGTLTARADYVVQEVVQNTAALRNHGTLLTMLQRDVTALRNDVTELRRGQEEIHCRLDRMEQNIAAIQEGIQGRLDRMEQNIAAIREGIQGRLDRMEQNIAAIREETRHRLDRMEQSIAAILAAVLPPGAA